jgi:YfiH family protein
MNILDRSALKMKNGLSYLEVPEIANIHWVCHAFLTRKGGSSPPPYDSLNLSEGNGDEMKEVARNRLRVANAFEFDEKNLVLLDQVHKDKILLLKEDGLPLPPRNYDAVITALPRAFLGILTADCIPIFVVDQKKQVIAAIHAGRHGTALHITRKVLKKMEEEFGCARKDLLISLGPSIGSCCYEIDEKVFLPEWEPYSIPSTNGKKMLDLARINIDLLKGEGIEEDRIFWIDLCTACHSDLFYSYRKEGRTGRQLSFIGIK